MNAGTATHAASSDASPSGPSASLEKLYLPACVLTALFAFAFTWATGHRGVFLLDQSMIFDGGWRILQGQTPYKDFYFPFGPLTFYIQAAFFRLLGVNWSATVVPACVLGALASLSVIRIVRRLIGGHRPLALCAGLATAISFQAPFGTLWLEQTAMFFDLLALQAVVESLECTGSRRMLFQAASGLLLAMAVLSKQNYGIFFSPVIIALLVVAEVPSPSRIFRALILAGVGLSIGIGIFLAYIFAFSDFSSFVQRTIVVAGEVGRERLTLRTITYALTFSVIPNAFQIELIGVLAGTAAFCLGVFDFATRRDASLWQKLAPGATIAILLPTFHSFVQASTLNDLTNGFAFVGLATCLGLGLILLIARHLAIVPMADVSLQLPSRRIVTVCILTVAGLWGSALAAFEARSAWTRTVQAFNAGTTFLEPLQIAGMERVKWGEPTSIGPTIRLQRADLEQVVSYLTEKKTPFFVMGDTTLLYGLLRSPSPQPLLYFLPSHSFLVNEIPRLDDVVLDSLTRNGVRLVVREKMTFLAEIRNAYPRFPHTWNWFTSNFHRVVEFGNYEIWEWRAGSPK